MRSQSPLGWKSGLVILGIIGLAAGIPASLRHLPYGIAGGEATTQVGLIDVPREGWDFALFDSISLLEENERSRALGRQHVVTTCVIPDQGRATLDRALAEAPADGDGVRSLWVRVLAKPYTKPGACQDRFEHHAGRSTIGPYLRILAVESVRPVPCGHMNFRVWNRRCAAGEQPWN